MIDIIIFAAIAAFMAFRLRSVLGQDVKVERKKDSVVPFRKPPLNPMDGVDASEAENAHDKTTFPAEIMASVSQMQSMDASFTLSRFLKGANLAFEKLLKAIAEADEAVIRNLMSEKMAKEFLALISERKSKGLSVNTTVISVVKSIPVEITLSGSVAYIKVNFTSEQINFTKNSQGVVIDGNASRIEIIEDSWVFERDLKSSSQKWLLTDTD